MTNKELFSMLSATQSDVARLQGLVDSLLTAVATLSANTGVSLVPPCECGLVTCNECLERALYGRTADVPVTDVKDTSPRRVSGTGSASKVTKDSDFVTVVVPHLASRVIHNRANGVECHTEKLTAQYGGSAVDFRFDLTRNERALMKAAAKGQNIAMADAVTALHGAVERTGGRS